MKHQTSEELLEKIRAICLGFAGEQRGRGLGPPDLSCRQENVRSVRGWDTGFENEL